MPRKPPRDLDFKIHVDESCLSAPMEEENQTKIPDSEPNTQLEQEAGDEPDTQLEHEAGEELAAAAAADASPVEADEEHPDGESEDVLLDNEQPNVRDPAPSEEAIEEPTPEGASEEHNDGGSTDVVAQEEPSHDTPPGEEEHVDQVAAPEEPSQPETADETDLAHEEDTDGEGEDTRQPSQAAEADDEHDTASLRESTGSVERKTSLRTEALIQAAARAVVARIEKQENRRSSMDDEHEGDQSVLSSTASDNNFGLGGGGTELTYDGSSDGGGSSRRESGESQHHQQLMLLPAASGHDGSEAGGDGGESSSHHEADDDVFSDRSPRSSLGSFDGAGGDDAHSRSGDTVQHHDDVGYRRSPRVSGISNMSQYEHDEFTPTARGTPRPAFRTPSAVRAIQMSSPTPSIFSSPRSSKRHTGVSVSGLPTVSRLGSPTVSAQYSPKGRSTPPRFKSKKDAPLVLLHVTLLPLRWVWGDAINNLDTVKGGDDYPHPSDDMETLRDAWRQLQARVGDTVLERGILLPHPQNDYEILEERLLEALELPLRRRARILECGHYLGPANEMTLDEEYADSDDEFASQAGGDGAAGSEKRHWCGTCRSEIKYDELGAGKVFRIKVYASNGLMKAGAWEACWKEMERVDVEVEPIVDAKLHSELEKLMTLYVEDQQRKELEQQEQEQEALAAAAAAAAAAVAAEEEDDDTFIDHAHIPISSPPMPTSPVEPSAATTTDVEADRRRRDEERLREIYGHTPPRHLDDGTSAAPPHPDSYIPPPTPPSPSEQAFERRETRRRLYQTASLPELLLEAARVVFQDRKNVAIALLSVLILMLAVRTAPPQPGSVSSKDAELLRDLYAKHQEFEQQQQAKVLASEAQTVAASQATPLDDVVASVVTSVSVASAAAPVAAPAATPAPEPEDVNPEVESASVVRDPCELPRAQRERNPSYNQPPPVEPQAAKAALTPRAETVTEKKVIRVYETVTETVKVPVEPVTVVESETVVETVRVTFTESVPAAAQKTEGVEEEAAAAATAAAAAAVQGPKVE